DHIAVTATHARASDYVIPQLAAEVRVLTKSHADEILALQLIKGSLGVGYKMRETKTYVLKNLAGQERTIILNHSPETEWKVVNPAPPAEQKEPGLQLKVTLRGGETVSREIVEERYRFDDTLLQSLGERGMHYFIDN